MDAAEALVRLGGISSASEIEALSSRGHLRGALRQGSVVRLGHNRYCSASIPATVAEAARQRAYLSHLSAALHHGWAVRFAPRNPVVTHDLSAADRDGWATSRLRTLRDCLTDLPFADALAVADSALRSNALTHDDLVRESRRWAPVARKVADLADGAAANPFESSLRAIAIMAGLHVAAQWEVKAGGVTVHPDVADPVLDLAFEADSWAHHAREPADHDRDCSRYNELALAGWIVLRFTWSQVMLDPESVRRTLEQARHVATR